MTDHGRWYLQSEDLKDLSPQKARDLIIKCFFEAQKETFKRAKQKFGKASDDSDILQRITSVVKLTFQQINGDFDQPTKETLIKVIERLAAISASWGTPEDIIEHHKKQIERVLSQLA
ncbi:MAG: hypothetical protein KJ915_09025 [Candidatus Omnitrophica bacterium]|nr:hypothetical protein [Candidatus Omnitrophota bacterium]